MVLAVVLTALVGACSPRPSDEKPSRPTADMPKIPAEQSAPHPKPIDTSLPFFVSPDPSCRGLHPVKVDSSIKPPRQLSGPEPVMSPLIRGKHIRTGVIIDVTVNADGKVCRIDPVAYGSELAVRACIESIAEWKFAPATKNGKPIAVIRRLDYRFRM